MMTLIHLIGLALVILGLRWLVRVSREHGRAEGRIEEFGRLRWLYFHRRSEVHYELLYGYPPPLDLGSSEPPAVSRKKTRGGAARSPLVDAAHLEELKKIYRPEDVDSAWAKLRAWLLTPAGAGKSASKRRLGTFPATSASRKRRAS